MIYNPFKSRDRSHYEQFHSYHRRLYERVEPTTATPFAISAINRGLGGALLLGTPAGRLTGYLSDDYRGAIDECFAFLEERCQDVQIEADRQRSLQAMSKIREDLYRKWSENPQV